MEAFLILSTIGLIFFAIYKLYQKIKNKLWFKKFRYYLKVIPLSIIIVVMLYFFLKEVYRYVAEPTYVATIVNYEEYNSTQKDGKITQNYSAIYSLEVDGKKVLIEEGNFIKGKRQSIGTKVEVLYQDEDVIEYNLKELFFYFMQILFGSLFILYHIKKEEFPDNLTLPIIDVNEDELVEEE